MRTSFKYLNRVLATIKYLIISLAIIFVIVVAGVNLPFVQRIITLKANNIFIQKKIPVHVESITLLIDGRIGLTKPEIITNISDTIAYAGRIKLNIKIIPLLLRKIRVENVTIQDAVVNLAIDSITGKLNIISVFSTGNKVEENNRKPGKTPDIGLKNVRLKNIRFTFNDKKNGTRVYQNVEKLNAGFDRFSLPDKEIFADYIELENASGGVELTPSAHKQESTEKSAARWKFKLNRGNLSDIKYMLLQPQNKQRITFSLSKGDIADAVFEPAGKRISVAGISLAKPGIIIYKSPVLAEKEIVSHESSVSAFPGTWIITGNNVKISDGFYHTKSYSDSVPAENTNSILQVATFTTSIKDLKLSSPESRFTMNRITVALDNGFSIGKGEISFRSDSTLLTSLQSNLETASGRINFKIDAANELSAIIRSWKTVPLSILINQSEISSNDILPFMAETGNKSLLNSAKNLKLELNCKIEGTTETLNIKSLQLKTPAGINLSVSGQVTNIIDPKASQINAEFLAEPFTATRLQEIIQIIGSDIKLPDFEPATIKGKINGSLVSQDFIINIESLSGIIAADGIIDLPDKTYQLNMNFSGIELGKLAGIQDMKRVSGKLDISGKGFSPDILNVKASVTIDSAYYKRHIYTNISTQLSGEHGSYNYYLISEDPLFKYNLTGSASLGRELKSGTISGTFNIDAGKLNFGKEISARGAIEADLKKIPGDFSGSITLRDLVAFNETKTEDLKTVSISFKSGDKLLSGKINADFVKADFRFAGSVTDFGNIFTKNLSRSIYLVDSTVSNRIPYVSLLPSLELSVESSYDPFLSLFVSDSIFNYNSLSIRMIKDSTGIASTNMYVDKLMFGKSSIFGAVMHFISNTDSSILQLKSDSIRYGKISLTGIETDLIAHKDTLLYRLKASTGNDSLIYDISGIAFKNEKEINFKTSKPVWVLNGYRWTVSPGIFLVLKPSTKELIADLHWKNDQHTIDIYGSKSEKLWFELNKVGLGMLTFPGMNTFGYDGELTGKVSYHGNSGNELGINMDIRQIKLIKKDLGNINITGSYVSDSLGNIESNLRSLRNDTSKLDIMLKSEKKTGNKSFLAEFSDIPIDMLEPLASKYVSGLKGEVNGELEIKSTGKKPVINGKIGIKNIELKVIPLNARFYLPEDVISLENSQMLFKQFSVLDSLNKKLSITGTLDLNDLGNVTADLQISSDHIQVMNTTSRENKSFNGSIFIDLGLTVKGAIYKPVISGNIKLAEGTIVNYKLTENLNVSETEKTITFMRLGEESILGNIENNILSRPNIEASIEINPNSLFNFEITRGYDIGINITGGGFLNYGVLQNGTISLNGTYEINQGNSTLKIPGWPRKDFVITAGSFVKWNGAVDNPELNIETTSKVRGSYYNPVDGKNREVNFIVNMKIYNSLSQLEIIFDVSSNDQYITSVFSTLSKDERMKQAINLLIFGRVELPNMASSSDYVTQQINQFWESQINQLTKSAIKGVDLSFGIDTYTGASEGGGEQTYTSFTYEVKKEMFHERGSVMVSGRMNDNSKAGSPTNNMLENFIFEYALDTNRTKYFKVYRQQNYEDLLEGEVIKSGVGYIYRKSYDRLHDIWRRNRKKVTENVSNSK